MTAGRQVRRSAAGIAKLVALAALVGAACNPVSSPEPTVGAPVTPLATPLTTKYQVEAMAWYAGLVIHFESAMSVIDESGGFVRIDIRLENPGTDLASLTAPIQLAAGGRAVDPVRGTVLPDIPAGLSVGTTLQFDLDAAFELQRAAVRIGRTAEHMVIVPLVAGTQDRITLEPRVLTLKGTATAGKLKMTLTGGELRADLPDWGLELDRATLALTVRYTARYTGDFVGGFAFTGANVGLLLPDGTIVASRPDGHSQSVAVLRPGTSVPNLFARFDVPALDSGVFGLIIRDGTGEAMIPITIVVLRPGG